VTYTPPAGFVGTDAFTYTIDDAHGGVATATVTVTVGPAPASPTPSPGPQVPPAPQDNTVTVPTSGGPTVLDLLGNDTDPNGDPLTILSITQPAHGQAVLNANGTVTYTPDVGYAGADSFTYTVSDGHGGTASAAVSLTVGGAAPAPTSPSPTGSPPATAPAAVSPARTGLAATGSAYALYATLGSWSILTGAVLIGLSYRGVLDAWLPVLAFPVGVGRRRMMVAGQRDDV
jgi:hypothetical protein